MDKEKQKLIVILGPTASGKSDLALELAKKSHGEIIAADSRTIYRGMDIGTAKEKGEKKMLADEIITDIHERSEVDQKFSIQDLIKEKPYMVQNIPHWGIDIVDPEEDFSVADFKKYAEEKIQEISARGHVPFLVGGTGLYIQAIVDDLSFTDVKPDGDLRKELDQKTDEELIEILKNEDEEAIEMIDLSNRRRLIRSIEVIRQTGSWTESQKKGEGKYDVLQIGITRPREELYERINDRVDRMVAEGLVDEVKELKEEYGCEVNAMTGIGYRQVCAFLNGYIKLRDAIELIKRDSRHYAKRQITWFKRDERIHWMEDSKNVEDLIKDFLK